MKTIKQTADVVVAGGGTAGHIAAIQVARAGVSVSLIEASSMLGGTMTDGGVFMPNHWHSPTQPVVQGIGWELFNRSKQIEGLRVKSMKERYGVDTPGYYSNINVPIYASVAEQAAVEAGVEIHYHEFIGEIVQEGNFWIITSYARGIKRITKCREVVDCSGDADVTRALGLAVDKSPKRQPGTLEYRIEGVDMQQVWEGEVQKIYEKAMEEGELEKGDWAYFGIYPFQWYLQMGGHNSTHIYSCDTSDADGQTKANIEGRARMLRMYQFVRTKIPGAERAVLKTMYNRALSREGYRVVGEHIVTESEFMSAQPYEDAVCNAFNYIDMHNEDNGCDEIFHDSMELLPTVPFRSLIPKGSNRITVAGRILSADRTSLAGIRAQCTCMAMGQAVGAAAALAVRRGTYSRDINVEDIIALTKEHGAVEPNRARKKEYA
ncbi:MULTISPECIES: FAD-dependent oxidoreductase [Vibrio]|uniref:FAD-dependent oxidoreductase n=1 Tax=Vibrio mediterranei TaxID=689 RepID=A0ABX5DB26_9VIBR|nr:MULTISPECIES: FAD-dependent oxidoreductase [Vibrio]MCF4175374.1 FAD-dependent oxidoreductase [Vibrio sp. McD22-P3]PCD85674.1 FAD-dependent oxidoreductase [Vibrio mediterranei]PRQ66912.1 FAD-dependent oxidoreductase [Vibrio mediterranei]SBO09872.1 Putative thiazole biosynthetic enzyme [Vibrio mediterranei]